MYPPPHMTHMYSPPHITRVVPAPLQLCSSIRSLYLCTVTHTTQIGTSHRHITHRHITQTSHTDKQLYLYSSGDTDILRHRHRQRHHIMPASPQRKTQHHIQSLCLSSARSTNQSPFAAPRVGVTRQTRRVLFSFFVSLLPSTEVSNVPNWCTTV